MQLFAAAVALMLLGAPNPVRLPAEVDDAYAIDANPAGLGFMRGAELRLRYAHEDFSAKGPASPRNSFGVYTAGQTFGPLSIGGALDVQVDGEDRTGYRLAFASALRFGALSLGSSIDRLRRPGGIGKTRAHLGLSYRFNAWLSAGLMVQDIAQTLDRRRWDLGLAVRPWDRVVLSARWRITQSQTVFSTDTLHLTGLASVEPIDGLRVGLGVQHDPVDDWAVTAQLDLSFGSVAVGLAALSANARPGVVTDLAVRTQAPPGLSAPSAVAVVDIAGTLQPKAKLDLLRQRARVAPYGSLPLLLEALATSDQVQGVFARIGPVSAGWAKVQEVRAGLRRIRAAGRRVDCQLTAFEDNAYLIATGCDSIILPPPSVIRADGVAATSLYFGDVLERVGLKAEVVRRGRYKSAPEQLTRSSMSPAQREATSAYLDDVYATLIDGISEGRGLEPDAVKSLLDMGTHTASQALQRGLVDHLLYPDEVEVHLQELYGRRLSFQPAADAVRPVRARWGPHPRVAVLYVDAAITGGDSEDLPFGLGQTVGARTLILALDALRTDPAVKAVVMRIDSPGGDSLASDLIARAVQRLAKVKPVIASLGDVAASGGYYVAAPARLIYAEPTTLTGSIGVFSMGVSAEKLLDRLGVGVDKIKRGQLSGGGSTYSDWSEAERGRVEEIVEHYYQRFLQVVAEGRKMSTEQVHAVAQGRIWSGVDAQERGLVDELGGLLPAIHRAKQEAGFEPDETVELWVYPNNRTALPAPLRTVAQNLGLLPSKGAPGLGALNHLIPVKFATWLAPWLTRGQSAGVVALLPFVLDID